MHIDKVFCILIGVVGPSARELGTYRICEWRRQRLSDSNPRIYNIRMRIKQILVLLDTLEMIAIS